MADQRVQAGKVEKESVSTLKPGLMSRWYVGCPLLLARHSDDGRPVVKGRGQEYVTWKNGAASVDESHENNNAFSRESRRRNGWLHLCRGRRRRQICRWRWYLAMW